MKQDLAKIENALKQPLPGKAGQLLMAPGYRPDYELQDIMKFGPKIGAVLLLLVPAEQEFNVILTLRKQYKGTHGGQMSFPGGKRDEKDENLSYTALRETQEEIGILPEKIGLIGKLSELYVQPSNFLVYPFVGVLTEKADFIKQENEVEEIIPIPLSFFLDPASSTTAKVRVLQNTRVEVPAYVYNGYTIWGATAIMMSEFIYLLKANGFQDL